MGLFTVLHELVTPTAFKQPVGLFFFFFPLTFEMLQVKLVSKQALRLKCSNLEENSTSNRASPYLGIFWGGFQLFHPTT